MPARQLSFKRTKPSIVTWKPRLLPVLFSILFTQQQHNEEKKSIYRWLWQWSRVCRGIKGVYYIAQGTGARGIRASIIIITYGHSLPHSITSLLCACLQAKKKRGGCMYLCCALFACLVPSTYMTFQVLKALQKASWIVYSGMQTFAHGGLPALMTSVLCIDVYNTLFWTINSWLMVWRALDCENRLTLVTLAFGYCPAFLALLSAGSIGWPTLYGPYKHTFSKSFSLILIHSSLNTRYNSKWRSRNTLFWPSNLVELLTWTHTKGREHHTSKLIKTETVKL